MILGTVGKGGLAHYACIIGCGIPTPPDPSNNYAHESCGAFSTMRHRWQKEWRYIYGAVAVPDFRVLRF